MTRVRENVDSQGLMVAASALSRDTAGKPKLPDGFEAETWAKLQDAVHAVHDKRPVSCSLEELYRVRPVASVYGMLA